MRRRLRKLKEGLKIKMINKEKRCPVCSAAAQKIFIKNNINIYQCTFCGLGYNENFKVIKGTYHRDNVYISEEDLFKNIFEKRVNIISQFINNGKVLEVGCATGILLSLLKKRGFDALGIEVSRTTSEVARKRGIDVIVNSFGKTNLTQKFDLVVFNHTLEHLKDLNQVLEKTNKLLNKNRFLFIDLPNFGGLSARILKSNWPYLLVSEHYWHFTDKALRILLLKHGFKIIYDERNSGIWDFGDPLYEIWSSLYNFKKRFFINILTAIPSFIITKLKLGSGLTVVAKKIN